MSLMDEGDAVLDCPRWARSLFTVRAAISFARLVEVPCDLTLSRMCSYFRSCFGVHAVRGMLPPLGWGAGDGSTLHFPLMDRMPFGPTGRCLCGCGTVR